VSDFDRSLLASCHSAFVACLNENTALEFRWYCGSLIGHVVRNKFTQPQVGVRGSYGDSAVVPRPVVLCCLSSWLGLSQTPAPGGKPEILRRPASGVRRQSAAATALWLGPPSAPPPAKAGSHFVCARTPNSSPPSRKPTPEARRAGNSSAQANGLGIRRPTNSWPEGTRYWALSGQRNSWGARFPRRCLGLRDFAPLALGGQSGRRKAESGNGAGGGQKETVARFSARRSRRGATGKPFQRPPEG